MPNADSVDAKIPQNVSKITSSSKSLPLTLKLMIGYRTH